MFANRFFKRSVKHIVNKLFSIFYVFVRRCARHKHKIECKKGGSNQRTLILSDQALGDTAILGNALLNGSNVNIFLLVKTEYGRSFLNNFNVYDIKLADNFDDLQAFVNNKKITKIINFESKLNFRRFLRLYKTKVEIVGTSNSLYSALNDNVVPYDSTYNLYRNYQIIIYRNILAIKNYQNNFRLSKFIEIVVHVGTSIKGAKRRWPLNYFFDLIYLLLNRYKCNINIIGTASDFLENDVIPISHPNVNYCIDSDLDSVCGLIRTSHLFIGNNSGPLHLADFYHIPTVSINGPTHHKFYPLNLSQNIVVVGKCKYLGCEDPNSCNFNVKCINNITVNDLFIQVQNLLSETYSI